MTPSAVTAGGLVLDIAGALILAFGLVLKTPEAALKESTPTWNFNASLDASIAAQTADAQVEATLLVTGFAVQLASALGWHESSWFATCVAVVIASIVAVAAWVFLIRVWRPHRLIEALFPEHPSASSGASRRRALKLANEIERSSDRERSRDPLLRGEIADHHVHLIRLAAEH
jgi:hypothetical protein